MNLRQRALFAWAVVSTILYDLAVLPLDVIGLFVQPLDDEHVLAHVLLVYVEDRLSDAEMIAFQHMIFGQDKPILESQRPRRLPLHGPLESHMRCDLASTR